MTHHRDRALLLMEQGRAGMARDQLQQALRDDPHDPFLLALLALCQADLGEKAAALETARLATVHGPDTPFAHYALSCALVDLSRADEAADEARRALALDPYEGDYHAALAVAHLQRRRWADALAAADAGLEADPEHVRCANLRAQALVLLGRRDEAAGTLGEALALDPENPHTHANQGWALLHRGRPHEALGHFREALRLDPGSAWARDGLVEAMKARNPVYAVLLRYFLWMGRLDRTTQWLIIVGGVVGGRHVVRALNAQPGMEPVALGVTALYLGWVLVTWTAEQLFNLVLFLDPVGRYALTREQRIASGLLGPVLLLALAMAVAGFVSGSTPLLVGAALAAGLMVPVAATFRVSGTGRLVMGCIAGCTAALLALAAAAYFGGVFSGRETADAVVAVAAVLIVVSSWVGNVIAARS